MVASKSNKVTKTPTKKTAAKAETTKKTTAPAEAGSKRKRTSKTEASNKKAAVAKEDSENEEEEVVALNPEESEEELTEEQEEALRKEILNNLNSSSEGEDSSEDEDGIDANENVITLDKKKLEKSMKETKETFEKKAGKSKKAPVVEESGVIYLGRIPHGFYEKEMKGYFTQFGDITRLRLSRNKKTGTSKHYGFVEFASEEVAKIVAETMHNYLLLGRLLQCKVIPAEKVHENLFAGADKVYRPENNALKNRREHNKPLTAEKASKKHAKLAEKEEGMRQSLKDAGIDYDFPAYA